MLEKRCEVSVVVPTRNRCALLRENLDSIFAQDINDYEVICADDDSADGTPELLASYGPRVRSVRGAWHAPGPARNAGARIARGRMLLFTDDDCTVPPDWIPAMLERRDAHRCDALSGGFKPHSLDTRASRYLHYRMRILFADKAKPVKAAPMMNFLITRALFEELGGFREEPWEALEDWEFCRRLTARGASLFYDPAVKVTHRYQTEWTPAMRRLSTTAARAVDVYSAAGLSVIALMARSTARALACPVWSLFRYPADLYATSVRVELTTYLGRLAAWVRHAARDSRVGT